MVGVCLFVHPCLCAFVYVRADDSGDKRKDGGNKCGVCNAVLCHVVQCCVVQCLRLISTHSQTNIQMNTDSERDT